MKKNDVIFALCLIITGCSYGYNIATDVTPITKKAYPPSNIDSVDVSFEDNNAKISRPYEQIAMIKVIGGYNSSISELLSEMKRKAAGFGADAVINVQQQNIVREKAMFALEVANNYNTISLTGIAIKYK